MFHSCALTEFIDLIVDIETFEEQFVILKVLLHSDRLKQYMVTIEIYQLLGNCEIYEHRCLGKIEELYTSAGNCNDQLKFKVIIELSMVSTPEAFIDKVPISIGPPLIVKKCSARKLLCLFNEVLDVKNKTAIYRVGAAKSSFKVIRLVILLWSSITNRKGHTKINEQVKKYLYN